MWKTLKAATSRCKEMSKAAKKHTKAYKMVRRIVISDAMLYAKALKTILNWLELGEIGTRGKDTDEY
jgi:aspartate ammonia-lyase